MVCPAAVIFCAGSDLCSALIISPPPNKPVFISFRPMWPILIRSWMSLAVCSRFLFFKVSSWPVLSGWYAPSGVWSRPVHVWHFAYGTVFCVLSGPTSYFSGVWIRFYCIVPWPILSSPFFRRREPLIFSFRSRYLFACFFLRVWSEPVAGVLVSVFLFSAVLKPLLLYRGRLLSSPFFRLRQPRFRFFV